MLSNGGLFFQLTGILRKRFALAMYTNSFSFHSFSFHFFTGDRKLEEMDKT